MRIENLRFLKLRPAWRCRHRWERVGRDGRHIYDICWRCMKQRSAHSDGPEVSQ